MPSRVVRSCVPAYMEVMPLSLQENAGTSSGVFSLLLSRWVKWTRLWREYILILMWYLVNIWYKDIGTGTSLILLQYDTTWHSLSSCDISYDLFSSHVNTTEFSIQYSRTLDDVLHYYTNTEISTSRYMCHKMCHKKDPEILVVCEC